MASTIFPRALAGLALASALVACDEATLSQRLEGAPAASAELTPRFETREVERPDIFSATEEALWDGRPSLGGVWVAHPEVSDPERVRVSVGESGRTVTAALFRRERNNPGPRIQLSSEAAGALGILAGQPTVVEVVVIRTEEVEIPPTPEEIAAAEAAAQAQAAAEAEAEAGADAAGAAVTAAAAGTAAAADAALDTTDAVQAPAPTRRRPFWDRFRRQPAPAPASVEGAAPSEVQTEPLDAVSAAAAAIDRVEASEAGGTFVELGRFTDEAEADAAASLLRQSGLRPTVSAARTGGRRVWRVLAGPAADAAAEAELLTQVRALGYPDAVATPN